MNAYLDKLIILRDLINHHPLFAVGLLLIVGYFLGKLAAQFKLPEITGFIIAGLVLGRSLTGMISPDMSESLKTVTEVALGFIALTIGGEFSWFKLKRTGREVIIVTVVQLLATIIAVTIGLWLLKLPLPFALLLGAIASATAPAATVAIVQSLRAQGLFIDYLYGVVALDDAGCVILFGIAFSVATSLLQPGSQNAGFQMILHSVIEVLISIFMGLFSGLLIHITTRKKTNPNEIMIISLGFIFLFTSVSIIFHLSPLLLNMAAGAILINLSARNHRIFRILEPLTPPVYALFFVIAGTELKPEILLNFSTLSLGIAFILIRGLSKYGGVYLGCKISGIGNPVKKYLGLCMLPQAGVAIGLVLLIQTSPALARLGSQNKLFADIILNMVNIVLLSVLINELIGPPLSKIGIIKGNEMEE